MLVKVEPQDSIDFPEELDIESHLFREQLFGNFAFNSDLSESGSDEDILSKLAFSYSNDVEIDCTTNHLEISVNSDSSSSGSISSSRSSNSPPESLFVEMDTSGFTDQDESELHIAVCSPSELDANFVKREFISPYDFNIIESKSGSSNSFWDNLNIDDVKPNLQDLPPAPSSDPESFLINATSPSNSGGSIAVAAVSPPPTGHSAFSNLLLTAKSPVKVVPLAPKLPCSTVFTNSTSIVENSCTSVPSQSYSSTEKQPFSTVLVHSTTLPSTKDNIVSSSTMSSIPTLNSNANPCSQRGSTKRGSASELELLALKRRERMIRNRESASLSRKKKKDYLSSLESRVKELTDENNKLKTDNERLQRRVDSLEKQLSSRKFVNLQSKKSSIVLLGIFGCFMLNFFGNKVFTEVSHNPYVFDQDKVDSPLHFKSRSLLSLQMPPENKLPSLPAVNQSHICSHGVNTSLTKMMYENLRQALNTSMEQMLDIPSSNFNLPSLFNGPDLTKFKLFRNKKSSTNKRRERIDELPFGKDSIHTKFSSLLHTLKNQNGSNYSFLHDHHILVVDEQNETCGPKLSIFVSTSTSELDKKPSLMQINCVVTSTEFHDNNSYPQNTDHKKEKLNQKRSSKRRRSVTR